MVCIEDRYILYLAPIRIIDKNEIKYDLVVSKNKNHKLCSGINSNFIEIKKRRLSNKSVGMGKNGRN